MNKTLIEYWSFPKPNNYLVKNDNYELIETGKVRTRVFFAWLPVYIGRALFVPLKDYKFKWFRYVRVTEKKVKQRFTFFDDGWTYQNYWGKWSSY